MSLADEFRDLGPWITQFDVGGQMLGGSYRAHDDQRLRTFLDRFPEPGSVLELGCLEGGHTLCLARQAREVVAVDAREENLRRARFMQDHRQQDNITFLQADLGSFDLESIGPFDVVFNVGLLYHLPQPWSLLRQLARIAPFLFLWTHTARLGETLVDRDGYCGSIYQEGGFDDPLSGTTSTSFWPTKGDLNRMLYDAGYHAVQILDLEPDHPHGPAVLLLAEASHLAERATRSRRQAVR
jgi:SAM-dependent methyltransferase